MSESSLTSFMDELDKITKGGGLFKDEPLPETNINDDIDSGIKQIVKSVNEKQSINTNLKLTESQVKDLLYYCFLNDIDIPKKVIKENKPQELLNIIKENLSEETYINIKNKLSIYTHHNNRDAIDLSELELKSNNSVKTVNIDYELLIGKKLPFIYQGKKGILTIVSVALVFTKNPSIVIDESYKKYEEQYNNKSLMILSKLYCKYNNKLVWISIKDLEKVNLKALFKE